MSSSSPRRPPWLADLLLRLTLPADPVGRSILGDLRAEYADASPLDSRSRPRWYWRQALGVGGRYGWRKVRRAAGLPPEPDPNHPTTKTKGVLFMESIARDVRYALRSFRKNPGFAAIAIIILALGIGANTAIFSVVDAVLLRSLPYPEADRIVRVSHGHLERGFDRGRDLSPQDFDDLRTSSATLEEVASYFYWPGSATVNLTGDGPPAQLQAVPVSEDFFPVLGGQAAIGRTFASDEFIEGQDGVVVLSAGLWQRQFGADPGVIGRPVMLGGMPFTVIGVMPSEFRFPAPEADLWIPMSFITEGMIPSRRHIRWRSVIARMGPGASVETVQGETVALFERLAEEYPGSNEMMTMVEVKPLRESIVGSAGTALWVLLGAAGLVLLIACANVGNLMLARATGRSREIAVRISMGAKRGRLIRQLLTESLVLALLGGIAGLILAVWGVDVLVAMSAGTIPQAEQIRFDGRLAGFALGVTALTGVVFGLFPVWQAARIQPQTMLKDGAGSGTRRGFGLQSALVVAEMTLAVMLVSGAGLMIKSFWQLTQVDPGFVAQNVLTVDLRVSMDELTSEEVPYRQQEYIDAVAELPGVIAVGGSKTAPLDGGGEPYVFGYVDDNGESRDADPESGLYMVTPGYFDALGIPMLGGRNFTIEDTRAVILNEAMARRLWGHADVAGRYMTIGSTEVEVIGVVGDVHNDGIATEARSAMYALPYAFPRTAVTLFIRTESDPLSATADVRRAIWSVDPNQPVGQFATLEQVVSGDVATPRFFTTLLLVFAGVAMALAALGIYGVISYAVGQRTSEMGLRMALGAGRGNLLRLVLGRSMALSLGGLALGLVGALALSRVLSSQLYGVSPTDVGTFAVVAATLAGVSFVAGYLPALRATRIDPVEALRAE